MKGDLPDIMGLVRTPGFIAGLTAGAREE